jgi:hypothetical protein
MPPPEAEAMKKTLLALAALAATTTSAQTFTRPVELGLSAGYAGGLSGEAFVHAPYVYGPFGVKAGVSYANVGNFNYDRNSPNLVVAGASAYCQDVGGCSTNGSNLIIGLDGTYALGELSPGLDADLYAGVRYGMFNRSLTAFGDTTTYSMNSFGLGGGLMLGYAVNPGLSLFGDLGADYFFNSALTSTNSTDSVTLNPGDADYAAFRSFTNMPNVNFKARVGVKFRL